METTDRFCSNQLQILNSTQHYYVILKQQEVSFDQRQLEGVADTLTDAPACEKSKGKKKKTTKNKAKQTAFFNSLHTLLF